MWCNGSTLTWNAKDVGLSLTSVIIFPIFITSTTLPIRQAAVHVNIDEGSINLRPFITGIFAN